MSMIGVRRDTRRVESDYVRKMLVRIEPFLVRSRRKSVVVNGTRRNSLNSIDVLPLTRLEERINLLRPVKLNCRHSGKNNVIAPSIIYHCIFEKQILPMLVYYSLLILIVLIVILPVLSTKF